jgi:hypothetical protein
MPPEDESMRSTPSGLTCRARAMESSMVQPPSVQSEAEMRSHRGRRSGQTLRTASMISRRMRVRFSKLPPYWSERVLTSGERNWWMR